MTALNEPPGIGRVGSRGQVLPLTLLILLPLVFFIAANGERWIFGIEKIRNQKEADSLVLILANQNARALNSIAALNQALGIAKERAYAMAVALVTLKACAVLTLGTSPCLTALIRLEKEAGPFFKKLKSLVIVLAQKQDMTKAWVEKTLSQMIDVYNLSQKNQKMAFAYHKISGLPIRRPEANNDLIEVDQFSQGNDLLRCNVQQMRSFHEFETWRNDGFSKMDKNDSLVTDYLPTQKGKRKIVVSKSFLEVQSIKREKLYFESGVYRSYVFASATFQKCESFHDILESLLGKEFIPIKIPPPYMLEKQFFEGGNRVSLAQVSKSQETAFDSFLKLKWVEPYSRPQLWALTEAEIEGGNLDKMEFQASLSKLTLEGDLWRSIEAKQRHLHAHGFETPPFTNFQSDLAH